MSEGTKGVLSIVVIPGNRIMPAVPRLVRPLEILCGPNRKGPPAGHRHDRQARRTTVLAVEQSDRVTERVAARMCGVGVGMIRLWVDTRAWPMPHRGGAAPPTFKLSEVKGWLATGTWPVGVHFRA
jgi:hypothetical protein